MEPCLENLSNTPLPDHMPVMVLPECHLFPGCLLPLYIFEERYRDMLVTALRSNRMFCIGNRVSDGDEDEISPHSTAGLVRCCVKQDDGTSHLLLLGLQRIRFTGWLQEKPFPIASIEPVTTTVDDPEEADRLKSRALELFTSGTMECAQQLKEMLVNNDDAELVCDVLSYHFTRCPKLQQMLLGEPSLERRYEMLIKALEKHKCD